MMPSFRVSAAQGPLSGFITNLGAQYLDPQEKQKKEAMQEDEDALNTLKQEVKKELLTHKAEVLYELDKDGKETRFFSKEFMVKINQMSYKYQIIATKVVQKQQEDRRFQALSASNHMDYAKAFYELEPRRLKMATEIEDIIFDYFGIIEMQYEASARNLRFDMEYQVDKIKM